MPQSFGHFIIACLAYYLAGRFGLMLAIPPGFASAIWPASGFALACLILLKRFPALLGVGVGSFGVNLGVASSDFTNLTALSFVPAIGIAVGTIAQVYFGYWLWQRNRSGQSSLDSIHQILHFILVVAPIGCLVAASIGVSTLYSVGFLNTENLGFTWLTWWVGDTIGMLLFTPLLIVIFSRDRTLSVATKAQVTLPTLAIFLGVLVLFYLSTHSRKVRIEKEISEAANHFFIKVQEQLSVSRNTLSTYTAIYHGVGTLSRQQFVVVSTSLLQQAEALRAIGWVEIVSSSSRAQKEQEIQQEGIPHFQFTEFDFNHELTRSRQRDEYYVVTNIVPLATNKAALGLDLGSNQDRLRALTTAMTSGEMVSTAPIRLAQARAHENSIIVYLPIFDSTYQPELQTPEYVKQHVLGFVSGVYSISAIVGGLIAEANANDFSVKISDITNASSPQSIIESAYKHLPGVKSSLHEFKFLTRDLLVDFSASEHFHLHSRDWTSWTILTIGFLFGAMLQALLLLITGVTKQIRNEVVQKTADYLRATKDAEAANNAKSNFLANMSHEFRTPLNAIIGFNKLCLRTNLDDTQKGHLEKVALCTRTLLDIINDTLDYSKIEAGKINIESVPFDPSIIFHKIESIFALSAESKNIEFNVEVKGPLPTSLIGDPLRLEQILLNICSNAVKFTETGSVTIHVENDPIVSPEFLLRINVVDTGIGISQEQQNKLFQLFHQADDSVTRKYGGTGLGLAISKQLTELMGGTIKIYSEINRGSTFEIRIPFRVAAELEASKVDASDPAIVHQPINLEQNDQVPNKCLDGYSILLVEDVELNRILGQGILEDYGAKVYLANDGEQALKFLQENTVDAVLMDVQMPVMDGHKATRELRKIDALKNLPVIATTANVSPSEVQKCTDAGMNAHTGKPLDEDELIKTLIYWLERSPQTKNTEKDS